MVEDKKRPPNPPYITLAEMAATLPAKTCKEFHTAANDFVYLLKQTCEQTYWKRCLLRHIVDGVNFTMLPYVQPAFEGARLPLSCSDIMKISPSSCSAEGWHSS